MVQCIVVSNKRLTIEFLFKSARDVMKKLKQNVSQRDLLISTNYKLDFSRSKVTYACTFVQSEFYTYILLII